MAVELESGCLGWGDGLYKEHEGTLWDDGNTLYLVLRGGDLGTENYQNSFIWRLLTFQYFIVYTFYLNKNVFKKFPWDFRCPRLYYFGNNAQGWNGMALAQWKTPKTTAQPRHLEDFTTGAFPSTPGLRGRRSPRAWAWTVQGDRTEAGNRGLCPVHSIHINTGEPVPASV